jgi:hypothetical protein
VIDGEAVAVPETVGEDVVEAETGEPEDFFDTDESSSVIVDGGNVSTISVTV